MKKRKPNFQNPVILFAAGFFVGIFVKFLPFFILTMFLILAAGGICRCISR